jgi:hypothetical protein
MRVGGRPWVWSGLRSPGRFRLLDDLRSSALLPAVLTRGTVPPGTPTGPVQVGGLLSVGCRPDSHGCLVQVDWVPSPRRLVRVLGPR